MKFSRHKGFMAMHFKKGERKKSKKSLEKNPTIDDYKIFTDSLEQGKVEYREINTTYTHIKELKRKAKAGGNG